MLICVFMPPYRKIGGILFYCCLSVRLSVCTNLTGKLSIFPLLLNLFSYKAHIWYKGTSHRYTSPGTKVKVICKGQGQISGPCFSKDGCFRALVFHKHILFYRSFHLKCEGVNNKNYECVVSTLLEEIIPEESYHKVSSRCSHHLSRSVCLSQFSLSLSLSVCLSYCLSCCSLQMRLEFHYKHLYLRVCSIFDKNAPIHSYMGSFSCPCINGSGHFCGARLH